MENSELEAMLGDSEEKKFNEWANQEIPFFEKLTSEEKEQLRDSYEKTEKSKEIWDRTMTAGMNHFGNGIDYSNDIDKSAAQWDQAKHNLEVTIGKLSEKHGKSK